MRNRVIADKKDIYVHDTALPAVRATLPDWYQDALLASSFVVYPIVVKENSIGLLYAAHREPGLKVSAGQSRYLKTLRNQVVLAIRQISAR